MIKRLVVTLALLIISKSALAEDCGLKRVAWLDAKLTPSGEFAIPAIVGGHPVWLALDTGAYESFLTEAFVERAGLQRKTFPGGYAMDVTGRIVSDYAVTDHLEVGPLKSRKRNEFGVLTSLGDSAADADGTLGFGYLQNFDVELDFAQKKVGFYLQDHCPGQVVHWAQRYDVIPIWEKEGHLTFSVRLDGKSLDAVVDTGAAWSTLDQDSARLALELKPGSPGLQEAGGIAGLAGRAIRAYRYQFKSLELPGVTFSDVPMIVADTRVGFDLILGMHELRAMHLYIAYKERKIYITATPLAALARDVFAIGDLIDRGVAQVRRGDYAQALTAFDRAIALDPSRPDGYVARGSTKYVQEDFAGAIADLSHAIGLDPDNVTALAYRGDAYKNSGAYELALGDIMATMRLEPENSSYSMIRGVVYFALGRYAEAASDFEQFSKAERETAYGPLWLHLVRIKQGTDDSKELTDNVARVDRKAWPWPVVALYQGKMTPDEVRAASAEGDDAAKKTQACEAAFYIGEYELSRNNTAAAIPLFREAASTCPREFVEYDGARAELKRLVP